jgi:DNA polymerase-3 subunit alpha
MPARRDPGAVAAEWDDVQRLEFEKEVLGFYVSGHPLARFQAVVESMGVTPLPEVAAKGAGARVLLFGQVTGLRETATRSGNRMAFATLEDMHGTAEVTVFPEPFKAAAEVLRRKQPLLIRGRIDDSDKGRVVLAEDVRPLEHALQASVPRGAAGGEPAAVRVRVPAGADPAAAIGALRAAASAHPGRVPVFVHVLLPAHDVVIRLRAVAVDGGAGVLAALDAALGAGAASADHA